ncbi:putative HTH-type transcriptional regulator lrs14 [Sulfolobales Virus YNP2]|uniref:putative HTH-type transcriptional regulator lrs14 n=1 Tax=Sulfolobales Virus YNP2 TaxID=1732180 RepID=UPI0007062AF1|nr:putative HTH-type transcriptional regulator lrs14 [Sulfolobales Virus YNP2]ALG97223.1 putative HTH-type transcriptional regulator lrs14 [Sulfolobales Virus YNP2]
MQIIGTQDKFVLPSGKELTLFDVLRFCYGLSESEINILMTLLKSSPNPKLAEDIEQELQVSKAMVNKSLNKLLSLGLIKRTKEAGNRTGRPRYVYFIPDPVEFKAKLAKEIEDCTNNIRNVVTTQFVPPFSSPHAFQG